MKKSGFKSLLKKIRPYAVPGIITGLVMIVILILKGIWPFGSSRIDYFDNMQQVAPLYAHLWDFMHGKASIWFDWYTGLGTNVSMSISAFSMITPFNLLLYFVPRSYILESISIITLVKMIFMSVAMYALINKKYNNLVYGLKVMFSCMYAFCGYVILYGSCFTPWMDIVAFFPILIMAYDRMLETGKKMLYICMIALCFIINYYLSAMSLIYIFLICGIRMVVMQERKQWKETAWNVGIGTIAGIGLSAFVLVPVFAQLSSSQRGGASKGLLSQYAGWITSSIVTDGAMAALQRWMMLYGLAFVIAVIIMGMKIYKSDRKQLIYSLAMLVVALGPVLMEATNLMWHFGSYNGYTLRNGYLISFTLICIAAGMAEKMFADIPLKGAFYRRQTAIVVVIGAVYVMIYNILPINNEMLAMAFFIMIFAIMFAVYMFMLIRKKEFNCKTVILVIALELFIGAYALIGPPKFYTYEDYQIGDYVQYANDAADSLDIEESATDRIVNPDISLNANYPLILRRGALSSFTAALEDDTQSYAKRWGYSKYFLWLLDSGGTVFSNAVLHVTQAVNINELDSALYTLEKKEGDYSLYNTNYNLPFGFCVDSSFSKLDMTNVDWITYHNRMYKAMTGDKETFVTRIYPQAETAGNIKSMTINVGSRSAIYMNIADVKKPNADANASKLESSIHVYVNGEAVVVPTLGDVNNTAYFTDYNNNLLYLGIFEDEDVQIKIEYDKPKYMNQSKMTIGLLNMEKMDKLCEDFADKQTDVSYTNNTLTVKINSDGTKDYALIPVIKSANWTVTLDGKTVKTKEIAGLFTGVQVHEGENTLVFTFVPKGRNAGLLITLVTLLITVLCLVINYKRTINVPVWAKCCAQYIYIGLFAIVVAAMFVVPVISTIPAAIYHIIRILLK
jgi:hypothetical protein